MSTGTGGDDGKYGILDAEAPVQAPAPAAGITSSSKVMVFSVTGKNSGTYRLNKDRVVIGSVVSADVRLNDPSVAPIHAVVERSADGAVIYDLASEAGISVSGQKTVTQALKGGEQLTIGGVGMTFTIGEADKQVPKDRVRSAGSRKLFLNPDEDLSPLLLESEAEVEQIFDYRPSEKRALEIVMSWQGTILDVEHFVKEKDVTIGPTRSSDFGIPPLLQEKRYAIVSRKGDEFVLNLDASMKGVLQRGGRLQSFDQLRSSGSASGIALGNDEFAKVSVGDVDFYMSYTAAPPRLKRSRMFERDPFFLKIFVSSLLMTAAMIMAIRNVNVPPMLEAEQIPERIATILYQPEKYVRTPTPVAKEKGPKPPVEKAPPQQAKPKPEPTPTKTVKLDITPKAVPTKQPVPKEMAVDGSKQAKAPAPAKKPKASQGQSAAKEGAGARAKGKEGTRGSPKAAANKTHQTAASRPAPQGGPGRGAGDSKVQDIGNVDVLNSATAKITDILGNSAAKLGKGGEKLKGFGGFSTQGVGGLALSGDGKGGGGTADSLGGLADKGTGGGRIGTGKGAAGTGHGIIGGQARVAIRSGGPEEAVVMGSIDASAVEAALMAHRDRFRNCYEREINAEEPDLAGRVSTSFVIGQAGRVTQAGIESSTLRYHGDKKQPVERCVLDVIRSIDFPIPRGAGLVQVTYPFKFSPNKR